MDILGLKFFLEVAEQLSFTKAAEKLFVSQPTLSRQIADLEKEIGVKLFIREKRTIRLTNAGKICVKRSRAILEQWNSLLAETQDLDSQGGCLKIGYMGSIEMDLLMAPVREIHLFYPSLNIILRKLTIAELYQGILENELDIIYTVSSGLDRFPDIRFQRIADNKLQIVVPKSHTLAARDSVSIKELSKERFTLFERSVSPITVDMTIDLCMQNGFSPSVIQYVRDAQTMLLMVSAGNGIAFLSSRMAKLQNEGLRFLDIEGKSADIDLVLAWKKDNHNPFIATFLERFPNIHKGQETSMDAKPVS